MLEELDRAERRRIVVLAKELQCALVERRTAKVDFDQILTTFQFDGIFDQFVVEIAVPRVLLNGILTSTVGHIFQGPSGKQARDRCSREWTCNVRDVKLTSRVFEYVQHECPAVGHSPAHAMNAPLDCHPFFFVRNPPSASMDNELLLKEKASPRAYLEFVISIDLVLHKEEISRFLQFVRRLCQLTLQLENASIGIYGEVQTTRLRKSAVLTLCLFIVDFQ